MNDELRLRKLIRQQMSGSTGGGYKTPGGNEYNRRDTTILHPDKVRPKNPLYYKPPTGQIYTPVGVFTRPPMATIPSRGIEEEGDQEYDKKKSRTSTKSNKNSRNASRDKHRTSAKKANKKSNYIDPKLLSRQQSLDKGMIRKQKEKFE